MNGIDPNCEHMWEQYGELLPYELGARTRKNRYRSLRCTRCWCEVDVLESTATTSVGAARPTPKEAEKGH